MNIEEMVKEIEFKNIKYVGIVSEDYILEDYEIVKSRFKHYSLLGKVQHRVVYKVRPIFGLFRFFRARWVNASRIAYAHKIKEVGNYE